MNNPPLPPNEAEMTPEQRKAIRRIQREIAAHFRRGLTFVIYKGEDQRLHVHLSSTAANREEALDMARRVLQETERAETGLITTLTPNEKRIVAP